MKTTILNVLECYVKKYSQKEKEIKNMSLLESPAMIGYFEAKDILSLKQALNEIRECCENNAIEVNTREYGNLIVTNTDNILQIIDKVLGDSEQ